MPKIVYGCPKCGSKEEKPRKVTDATLDFMRNVGMCSMPDKRCGCGASLFLGLDVYQVHADGQHEKISPERR